jgi:hypothetical protein
MSRIVVLVLVLLLGSLLAPGRAFAQLTPPAGSAGAGNAPISGVPYGPANPRALSDPSGIGNAGSVPPLRSNSGAANFVPSTPNVSSTRPARVATPYARATQRLTDPDQVRSNQPRGREHHREQPETSKFTGICRGC